MNRDVLHALALLTLLALAAWMGAAHADRAADDDWVLGRWELVYDPDGSERDWLEFLPGGDAFSIWPDGRRVPGIYVVTAEGVKAVFTLEGRDIITTFHADPERRELRIVTSPTGVESVYRRSR